MRVSQIQNLTWAANVLVLGGLVWVGLNFWRVKTAKPSVDLAWPKAARTDAIGPRWPGELSGFADVWKTPINGVVPPPPVKAEAAVKPDRTTEFKSKLKYLGGFEFMGTSSARTTIRVSYDGKEQSVSPGGQVAGFKLVQVELAQVKDPNGMEATTPKLTFQNPDTGANVEIVVPPLPAQRFLGPNEPWKPQPAADIEHGPVKENGPLDATPYTEPATGDVVIPFEAQDWIAVYGEKNLLGQLGVQPKVDGEGKAIGIRIVTVPGQGTPLGPTSNVYPEDVIRSINGVPVTSKEDVILYLRGAGKGLSRYEVVLDRAGQEKTVVYRVPQRTRVASD